MNIILKLALLTIVLTQGVLVANQETDASTVQYILSCSGCKK